MPDLQRRFVRFVRARHLVADGDRVLVALSGGVDSVALLHLFRSASESLSIALHAAHFDHAMRPDSARDAEWVAGLCKAWEIPLVIVRAERPLYGETDARHERYRFLHYAAQQAGATRIATAHHADDQIETVLFRLLRGTGMRGLAGIPVRRGPFIRPLLRSRKADLLEYAAANGLQYRADPSNDRLEYVRNRIRKTVIPALETVRADAGASMLRLARYAARTEAAWQWTLDHFEKELIVGRDEGTTELARAMLLEYHPELRARVLRHVLRRYGVVPGRASTKQLLRFCENAQSGAAVDVAGRVKIERSFDRIRIHRVSNREAADAGVRIRGRSGAARLTVGGRAYDVAWSTDDVRREGGEYFDPAVIEGSLDVRGWRAGDRIVLPYGTKKLKKLFGERRIPASERTRIPILSDDQGRILWAAGVARSVHAVPAETGPALNITVTNAESR